MMLDLRFSVDYYLRVLELAIRDESRILVYDQKQLLLEAWPRHQPVSVAQDASLTTIKQAIQVQAKKEKNPLKGNEEQML